MGLLSSLIGAFSADKTNRDNIESQEKINKDNIDMQLAINQQNIDNQNKLNELQLAHDTEINDANIAMQERINKENLYLQDKINAENLANQTEINDANIASAERINAQQLQNQKDINDQNIAFQQEVNERNSISGRIEEGRKNGLNALSSMGLSGNQTSASISNGFSPQYAEKKATQKQAAQLNAMLRNSTTFGVATAQASLKQAYHKIAPQVSLDPIGSAISFEQLKQEKERTKFIKEHGGYAPSDINNVQSTIEQIISAIGTLKDNPDAFGVQGVFDSIRDKISGVGNDNKPSPTPTPNTRPTPKPESERATKIKQFNSQYSRLGARIEDNDGMYRVYRNGKTYDFVLWNSAKNFAIYGNKHGKK